MSVELEEPAVEQTETNAFDALFDEDQLQAEDATVEESPAEETPAPAPETEPEPVAEAKAASTPSSGGVSPAMREAAISQGIPEAAIAMAPDDASLSYLLALARTPGNNQPEPEQAAAAWEIPEDEFDSSDPMHKQVKLLTDSFNQQFSALKTELSKLQQENAGLLKTQNESVLSAVTQRFDGYLDELNAPQLGASLSPKRGEVYELWYMMKELHPDVDEKVLAHRAARAVDPEIVTTAALKKQEEKLSAQSRQVLGGGPSPKTVDKPEDPMIQVGEFIDGILGKK